MAGATREIDAAKQRTNRLIAASCAAFFAAMIGVSYAAVPLYALFCQITGYGGTTQRVTQFSDTILDRKITVRFDANVSGGLPWEFQPVVRSVELNIGETIQADYRASNLFGTPASGRATFNVTPEMAGAYFNKVECFCFTDTELKPGETLDMPVVFFVDPAIVDVPELRNIRTITLSYTFFPTGGDKPVANAPTAGGAAETTEENLGG